MLYPQTPWVLKGYAIQTLHLFDVEKVRSLIPSELKIFSVFPGKTIGGIYLSYYGSGSVLEYSELIVIPAMVSYQGQLGGWVSHIYVDNTDSVAGGREIWGLPKELAEFTWSNGEYVTVCQGKQALCNLHYDEQSFAWRQKLGAFSFSVQDINLLRFSAEFESRMGLIGSKLEVPTKSSFSGINFGQPLFTLRCEEMTLRVDAPAVVAQRKVENRA